MTAALAGAPDTLVATADVLTRVVADLDGFRGDVGGPVRTTFADWRGTAAPVAVGRLDADLDVLARATQVCLLVAPALRAYAEELRRAQPDVADGEALAATDPSTGTRVVESATAALGFAAEDAARAVREATALLPAPTPVDVEGGDLLDGLRKSGGDLLDEVGSTLLGARDHVNPFSDRFGAAWSQTGSTIATVATTNPMTTLGGVVDGVTAPVTESYRTGGVDEAAGRGAGAIAAALLGGKGLTKLGHLAPEAPPTPSGIGPPEFARPQTRLVPGGGLQRNEEHGGHVLDPRKAHVGATDQQMLDRQATQRRPTPVSSFTDRQTAENAVSENMRRNKAAIDEWLADSGPDADDKKPLRWEHAEVVGRSAPKNATLADIVDERRSTVVLRRDPSAPSGYYVLSSYPGV